MSLASRLACRLDVMGVFGQFRGMDTAWAAANRPDMRMVEAPQGTVRLRHAEGAPSARPPLVLLVDPPNHPEHYDALMGDLLADGWPSVTVVETLGFGFSRPSRRFDFAMAPYVASLLFILDQLGLDRVVLYGPCIEGFTALRFAQQHPERVAALGIAQVPSWTEATETWLPTVAVLKDDKPFLGQIAFGLGRHRYVERAHKVAVHDASLYPQFRAVTAEAEKPSSATATRPACRVTSGGPRPTSAPSTYRRSFSGARPTGRIGTRTVRAGLPTSPTCWRYDGTMRATNPELEKPGDFVRTLRALADRTNR